MTSPIEETPDGMLDGLGGIAAWGTKTQAEYEAERVGLIENKTEGISLFSLALTFFKGGFPSLDDLLGDLAGAILGTSTPGPGPLADILGHIGNIFTKADNAESAAVDLTNRVETLEGGGTRTTYAVASTWTNPGPGYLVTAACINGGQGGYDGGYGSNGGKGGRGGIGGGWVEKTFNSEDLSSTVAVSPGAGGAVNGGAGGTSTFGSYVTGVSGVGAIISAKGAIETSSKPGNGGAGADYFPSGGAYTGQTGGSSALAAGGAGSSGSTAASAGASPSSDPLIAAGGGGGGGGGVSGSGAGGDGGGGVFGSGGGGGGAASGSFSAGDGALGGAGRVVVTVKVRAS